MFTDIQAAIEEAQFLAEESGYPHCVYQRGDVMVVGHRKTGTQPMYTSRKQYAEAKRSMATRKK